MKTYKSIAYAYATSPMAKELGFYDDGCFYIQQRSMNEAGDWNTYAAHNAEGFKKAYEADLIAMFKETDGDIDWMFLRHGSF